jgi:hypothetical protein
MELKQFIILNYLLHSRNKLDLKITLRSYGISSPKVGFLETQLGPHHSHAEGEINWG